MTPSELSSSLRGLARDIESSDRPSLSVAMRSLLRLASSISDPAADGVVVHGHRRIAPLTLELDVSDDAKFRAACRRLSIL